MRAVIHELHLHELHVGVLGVDVHTCVDVRGGACGVVPHELLWDAGVESERIWIGAKPVRGCIAL
jgi:hypothetical protein